MTSSIAVAGFASYEQNTTLPNLEQILLGKAPANKKAITFFTKPGRQYFYLPFSDEQIVIPR